MGFFWATISMIADYLNLAKKLAICIRIQMVIIIKLYATIYIFFKISIFYIKYSIFLINIYVFKAQNIFIEFN